MFVPTPDGGRGVGEGAGGGDSNVYLPVSVLKSTDQAKSAADFM